MVKLLNMPITIPCQICKKSFNVPPSRKKRKYCSFACSDVGRHRQEQVTCTVCKKSFTSHLSKKSKYCSKQCYGVFNRGENNYAWKGSDASYRSQHHWIQRMLGKATHCVDCGLNKMPKNRKRYFQWANISGKYIRQTSDYKSLCVVCHKRFDKKVTGGLMWVR